MIISRTPLRVSFCGGGSDLPAFYREHGGAVLSMSIKRYVYLSMHKYFESDGYILKYSQLETPREPQDIAHRILREVFSMYGIRGVDFNSSADVPAGTGLGSSSAFTVGLLNLCNAFLGRYMGRSELAEQACEVELQRLGEPIGKQDQYGCALGGLNFIQFHPDESVTHEAVPISRPMRDKLERSLVMLYLGGTRSASDLLARQTRDMVSDRAKVESMKAMVAQAQSLRADIVRDVDVIGPYLDEAWQRKRALTEGISNPFVDDIYRRVRDAGATGGKLLGAGQAGFLLAYAPDGAREEIIAALPDHPAYDVSIDTIGTTIIYSN